MTLEAIPSLKFYHSHAPISFVVVSRSGMKVEGEVWHQPDRAHFPVVGDRFATGLKFDWNLNKFAALLLKTLTLQKARLSGLGDEGQFCNINGLPSIGWKCLTYSCPGLDTCCKWNVFRHELSVMISVLNTASSTNCCTVVRLPISETLDQIWGSWSSWLINFRSNNWKQI